MTCGYTYVHIKATACVSIYVHTKATRGKLRRWNTKRKLRDEVKRGTLRLWPRKKRRRKHRDDVKSAEFGLGLSPVQTSRAHIACTRAGQIIFKAKLLCFLYTKFEFCKKPMKASTLDTKPELVAVVRHVVLEMKTKKIKSKS